MRLLWLLVIAALVTGLLAFFARTGGNGPSYLGRGPTLWKEELGSADASVWQPAWERLRAGGLEALPVVIALADSGSERSGWRAGELLQELAADLDVRAVPALLEALGGEAPWRRSWAADALGRVHPLPEEAVAPLVAAAADPEAIVRVAAVRALTAAGAYAEQSVPVLTLALTDADPFVREHAAKGLRAYGDRARPAHDALVLAIEDEFVGVAEEAVETLAEIGPQASALPMLIDALEHGHQRVTWWAAIALERMGDAALPAVPALVQALGAEDERLRALAATALGATRTTDAEVHRALAAALADKVLAVRRNAAEALGRLGTSEPSARAALEKAAREDHEDEVRTAARAALDSLGD